MTRQSRSIRHSPWHEDYQRCLSILDEFPDEVFPGAGAYTNKEIGEVFSVRYTMLLGKCCGLKSRSEKTWRSNDMRRRSLKRCNNMTYEDVTPGFTWYTAVTGARLVVEKQFRKNKDLKQLVEEIIEEMQ